MAAVLYVPWLFFMSYNDSMRTSCELTRKKVLTIISEVIMWKYQVSPKGRRYA